MQYIIIFKNKKIKRKTTPTRFDLISLDPKKIYSMIAITVGFTGGTEKWLPGVVLRPEK